MAQRTVIRKEIELRNIPAPLAGLLSLLVPGLGQIALGLWKRGLSYLLSIASLAGLIFWRIRVTAYRQATWAERFPVAFRRQPILIAIIVVLAILWLLVAWDALRLASRKGKAELAIYLLIGVLFFTLGWQIVEINLYKLATQLPDAIPVMRRIAWPWPKAIIRELDINQGQEYIYTSCDPEDDTLPAMPRVPGEPYLEVTPRCGELSDYGVEGTRLLVHGYDFRPDEEIVIWWIDPIGKEFRVRYMGGFITAIVDEDGQFTLEFPMPNILIPPSASEGVQTHHLQARQTNVVGPPRPSEELLLAIEKMVETIFLGMMATLFGIVFAIPISFLAARNLMGVNPITLGLYYAVRFILNIVRSIEPLIWAIVAILWVGLGPFAGIIALTVHTIAALGKLYSESIESIDPGPIEAIQATGANWLQVIMYAVVPQIIPPFVSFTIYRWDINIRMSTIIGAVGGGGIGFLLIQWIRLTDYRAAGIAVWFIAITVSILDFVSANIRERYI